jgi:lipopolysaccharide/colanic/teichoic acid biosynthesis glycosyltransferase
MAFLGVIILLPFLCIISLLIILSSRGSVFYKQKRVGKNEKEFSLLKFRTMKKGADKLGLLTIGGKDSRVTKIGYFLRKFKLDEIPQILNIIAGKMSIVGPRPEVAKYVALYTTEQKKVLKIRPGLTDLASIKYINESELLAKSDNPEKLYVEKIMPDKLKLNLRYIETNSFGKDIQIIFQTIVKILR